MIKTEKLTKLFTTEEVQTKALNEVTLQVEQGEFVAIMGPSGCGKSTLLNILGTLDSPTSGSYSFEGKQVDKMNENQLTALRKGNLGFIFQSFNLIDELTVYENVELPLIYMGIKAGKRKARVNKVLEKVNLLHRVNHYPQQLSGGQQQRVAIARALVKMPHVLLLDEPLSNLDARLRLQTREEIRKIQKATKITTVFVTHDQEEAMSISDCIVVMKDGLVQQTGKPQQVYDDPCNLFVARFLGTPQINVFKGFSKDGGIYLNDQKILSAKSLPDQELYIGIRPEGFILREDGPLSCQLSGIEVMGRDISVVSTHPACENQAIRSIISAENKVDLSSSVVHFALKPGKVFLFNRATDARIPADLA